MSNRAESIRVMCPLFQAGEGGSLPTSALQLFFHPVTFDEAKPLNRLWHSRFPELGGGNARACYVAEHDGRAYAVAVWTNPSSPKLPQTAWLMLKRYAVADDAPAYTAGRMMGWMIRETHRQFPEVVMLVSYSDPETHAGTIYRATGWVNDGQTRRAGVRWHNRDRHHTANAPCAAVVRWLYPLTPASCQWVITRIRYEQRKRKRAGVADQTDRARAAAHLRLLRRRAADLHRRGRGGRAPERHAPAGAGRRAARHRRAGMAGD